LGKNKEALVYFNDAIKKINPNYAWAWYNKGRILMGIRKYQQALACFDKAAEIDPKFSWAWYYKGRTLNILGRYKEALACFDKTLAIV
jgi:tetratricopeptide (TPR) repeat protein